MQYLSLTPTQINHSLFRYFTRRQVVTDCLRHVNGAWVVQNAPFIDDWDENAYTFLIQCLQNTIATGGVVFGAFEQGQLKGFASVEGKPFGKNSSYLDLTSLHVSADRRGKGIGRSLFSLAASWAKSHGAKKLYISSHSAVETQAFYAAMGCVDAMEQNISHVEAEPYDRQLEYVL